MAAGKPFSGSVGHSMRAAMRPSSVTAPTAILVPPMSTAPIKMVSSGLWLVPRQRVRFNIRHTLHGLDDAFLIAEAGRLHAAERGPFQAIAGRFVHVDGAGFEFGNDALNRGPVITHNGTGEAVFGVVRDLDRLIERAEADDGGNRTERFTGDDRVIIADIIENGGSVNSAISLMTSDEFGAAFQGQIDAAVHFDGGFFGDHRAYVGGGIVGIA